MIDNVSRMRSEVGASTNSLEGLAEYNDSYNTSIQSSMSQIGDAGYSFSCNQPSAKQLSFPNTGKSFFWNV